MMDRTPRRGRVRCRAARSISRGKDPAEPPSRSRGYDPIKRREAVMVDVVEIVDDDDRTTFMRHGLAEIDHCIRHAVTQGDHHS